MNSWVYWAGSLLPSGHPGIWVKKNGQPGYQFDLSTHVNRIGQMSNHFNNDLRSTANLIA
jgi:hypothetical protein